MPNLLPKHRAREYETVFILNPETANEGVDTVSHRLTDVIGRLDGRLLRAENWGRRRLAYPVRKNTKGIYLYLKYLGYSDMVAELERNLRMLEPVIKFITVKLDEDVNPESHVVREGDINFIAQYEEEPEREHVEPAVAFNEDEERVPELDSPPSESKDGAPEAEAGADDETDEDEE
jgi:small subunit ribosomal protein S6